MGLTGSGPNITLDHEGHDLSSCDDLTGTVTDGSPIATARSWRCYLKHVFWILCRTFVAFDPVKSDLPRSQRTHDNLRR